MMHYDVMNRIIGLIPLDMIVLGKAIIFPYTMLPYCVTRECRTTCTISLICRHGLLEVIDNHVMNRMIGLIPLDSIVLGKAITFPNTILPYCVTRECRTTCSTSSHTG